MNTKHDRLLAKLLQPNTYKKRSSLAIVDGFAVEMTQAQVMPLDINLLWGVCVCISNVCLEKLCVLVWIDQAAILEGAKEVRIVEKNQELA